MKFKVCGLFDKENIFNVIQLNPDYIGHIFCEKSVRYVKDDTPQVDNSKKYNLVTQGSTVTTDKGVFFISIGIGKLQIGSNNYFIISLLSPIGSVMKGLSKNETFTFRGIKYSIKNIE